MKNNKIKLFTIFLIINFFSVNAYDLTNQSHTMIQTNKVVHSIIESQQTENEPLIVGKAWIHEELDPANSFNQDLIHQVCDSLYAYDLFDPEMPIIPRLASDIGTWSDNGTEYTVPLRDDVTFHNGYEFNASVVNFTFSRINYLLNKSLLDATGYLFTRFGESQRLINHTVVEDTYTIKFVLNYPFLSFPPFLCFSATSIVEEHSIPYDRLLKDNETLIGTGQYKYISNDWDEVKLEYYPDYFRGGPEIEEIIIKKYSDKDEIAQALLAGDIHFSTDIDVVYIEDFIASEELMVEESTTKTAIFYIGMNNEKLNTTIRRAINYAIDYDYIINDIYNNQLVRMTSIIPPGMLYHKECDVPTLDLNIARQILIDAGLSKGLTINSPDCDWIDLSFTDPIVIANYTYSHSREFSESIGYSIESFLRYIGISVKLDGVNFTWQLTGKLRDYPDECDIYDLGWAPENNDQSSFINTLFVNTSEANYYRVNDPWLEQMMNESLDEIVESLRREKYYQIQEYIALNLMPIAPVGFNFIPGIHSYEIKNIPFNPFNILDNYVFEWDSDTDEDGIIDSKEIDLYFTDSNDNDTDNDGLSDGEEINTFLTDPNDADSDKDTIPDGWEVFHSLDPLSDDTSYDNDNNGLSNLDEFIYNTEPNSSDSDVDDLFDGEEVVLGSDGYITNPNDPDSDDDTFSDGEEAEWGTNPLDPHIYPTFYVKYEDQIWQVGLGVLGALGTAIIGVIFAKGKKRRNYDDIE